MSNQKSIYARIVDFQSNMTAITKDATNPFFKSKYADLPAIQAGIQKPLSEAGLGYIQMPTIDGLITRLFSIEGETIESVYPMTIQGKPQDIGSAVSYAKRYALTAILGIIIDDSSDDDGQSSKIEYEKPKTKDSKPPVKWLSEEKLQDLLSSEDPIRIKTCLDCKEIEGIAFQMKSEYRAALSAFYEQLKRDL